MVWLMGQIEMFLGPTTEVVIVIDVSGSMVKLDPKGLAREGSKMISDISEALQAPVRFSLILYGEKSRVIGEGMNPGDAKRILTDSLMNVKPEKYSDLRSALNLAKGILKRRSERRQAYVIVLTDGRIREDDIPPGEDIRNYLTTLSSMASDFKENKWNVFVFSTQDAESAIIDLANSSGGAYTRVNDLSEISTKFMNLLEGKLLRFRVDVKPSSLVEIPVEEGVAEIGVVVAFDPREKSTLKIYDPSGKEVEGNRKEGRGYTIFTVSNPKPGIWKFEISKGATVLLSMAIPKIVYPSGEHPYTEPINVKLRLEPILPKHPDWKNFSARIYVEYPSGKQEVYELYDDGKNGDEKPGDGIFGRNIGRLPEGEYVFTAVVNHKPTNSEVKIRFQQARAVYSDTLRDKAISEGQRPQIEKLEPFEIPPSKGQASAYNLNLNFIVPKDAKSGTYNVLLRGTQTPPYRKIEISYPSKVGSWKALWMTVGGVGALVVGGVVAWRTLR